MHRTNHIFIDFENVQETDLDRIAGKAVKVTLVLGERHKSLPVPLVRKLLKYASQVELVETGRGGKNALDLVLAQHIGEARSADPGGYFHIISKDKDFDPLIGHLKDCGTLAARRAALSEIPSLMTAAERRKHLAEHYRKSQQNGRAKKRTTLAAQIQSLFAKSLTAEEIEEAIRGLIADKVLTISDKDEVVYH